MKKALLAAAFVTALSLPTLAADQKPAISQHLAGSNELAVLAPANGIPPGLCNPCLFYGGDLDPTSENAAGLSDENTLYVTGSSTYAAYEVPSGYSVKVTGILFNIQASANFDQPIASYDVRTGVSEGNGGASIASGTGTVYVEPTGRTLIGLHEYTVAVFLPQPLDLSAGEYWFNLTPVCTNGAVDGSCYVGRMFLSNTTHDTNGVYPLAQPDSQLYLNSAYFGYTWANWCDSALGFNAAQCRAASFGLSGTGKRD
jgi:hypothetical protein